MYDYIVFFPCKSFFSVKKVRPVSDTKPTGRAAYNKGQIPQLRQDHRKLTHSGTSRRDRLYQSEKMCTWASESERNSDVYC